MISDLENGAVFSTFEELLTNSDFVIATCALTEDTRNIFNRNAFDLMKPAAVFINSSRGGIYDFYSMIASILLYYES